MKFFFLTLFVLFPVLGQAVPERSVYPNSGATDAQVDENTDISTFPSPPIEAHKTKYELEEDYSTPVLKSDALVQGPYDRKGNYRYIPEVRK